MSTSTQVKLSKQGQLTISKKGDVIKPFNGILKGKIKLKKGWYLKTRKEEARI